MNSSPGPGPAPIVARAAVEAYALADAAVRFRSAVEHAYLGVGDHDPDAVPPGVDDSLAELRRAAAFAGDVLDAAAAVARELTGTAARVRALLAESWDSNDRQAWLDEVWEPDRRRHRRPPLLASGEDDRPGRAAHDALARSAVGPTGWDGFEADGRRLRVALGPTLTPVFDLGRLLAAALHPTCGAYDSAADVFWTYSPPGEPEPVRAAGLRGYIAGELAMRVAALLRTVWDRTGLLVGLVSPLTAGTGDGRVVDGLRIDVRRRLAEADARPSAPVHASPLVPAATAPPPLAPGEVVTLLALRQQMDPGEMYIGRSRAVRQQMDPGEMYIGRSRAVLRMFREIDVLNGLPDDPVVILGPSGAGKTRLAQLLHSASARRRGPFVSVSADEVAGGDRTIQRVKWAGYGCRSGLAGVPPNHTTPGLLRQAEGGTLFVDELHTLDHDTLNYLRTPLDRQPVRPAAGEGEAFTPDVRFVFATYRPIHELQADGVLPPDFVRRLRGRYLKVPPLSDRREDIPLFVERFRDDRVPGECFLLALLRHDWGDGEVDKLITVIRTAAAGRRVGDRLLVSDLVGYLPESVVAGVAGLGPGDVTRELYTSLIRTLEEQGYARGLRGAGLQERLAELLATSAATVSRQLSGLRLAPASSTQQNPASTADAERTG